MNEKTKHIIIYTAVSAGGGMGTNIWDEGSIKEFETEKDAFTWIDDMEDDWRAEDINGPFRLVKRPVEVFRRSRLEQNALIDKIKEIVKIEGVDLHLINSDHHDCKIIEMWVAESEPVVWANCIMDTTIVELTDDYLTLTNSDTTKKYKRI